MASFDLVPVPDSKFYKSTIGDAGAILTLGSKLKFIPNLNLSLPLESTSEKLFLNFNRIEVIVGNEVESFDSLKKSIKLTVGKQSDIFYVENDVLKWDIELIEKPISNIFEWNIICSPGITFYYQPELSQDEINEGCIRPDNVVGSYAVYCDNTGHFKTSSGKTIVNYRAGKICHIYRPLCIDAKGASVWADMLILDGRLTVTVPQLFLDNSKYPVIIDPEFGYHTAGGTDGLDDPSYLTASPSGAPASSGITKYFYYYTPYNESATNIKMGLYTHSSGPSALVSGSPRTGSMTPTASTWRQIEMSGLSVTGSATYWITHVTEGTPTYKYDTATDSRYRRLSWTYATAWPDPFSSEETGTRKFSIYIEYQDALLGSTCWGHDTGVTQTNVANLSTWTGTGTVSGSGDAEKITLESGQYMESPIVEITGTITLEIDQYGTGDGHSTLKYKTAATSAGILGASWTTYSGQFSSSGFVQLRVEEA